MKSNSVVDIQDQQAPMMTKLVQSKSSKNIRRNFNPLLEDEAAGPRHPPARAQHQTQDELVSQLKFQARSKSSQGARQHHAASKKVLVHVGAEHG